MFGLTLPITIAPLTLLLLLHLPLHHLFMDCQLPNCLTLGSNVGLTLKLAKSVVNPIQQNITMTPVSVIVYILPRTAPFNVLLPDILVSLLSLMIALAHV